MATSKEDSIIHNSNPIFNSNKSIIDANNVDNCIVNSIPVKNGFMIDGCLNRNVISSMLFLLPAIYGYIIKWVSVSVGSIVCFFTSIINHYHTSQHKLFRPLDIVCVNSIAFYFLLYTIYTSGISFYSTIMYVLSILTLSIYFYIHIKTPDLYAKYYCWVHICAVTGIMFCIKSYDTYLNAKNANAKNANAKNDVSTSTPLGNIT